LTSTNHPYFNGVGLKFIAGEMKMKVPSKSSWLTWRTVTLDDEHDLHQFDAACKSIDGFEPVSNIPAKVLAACIAEPDNTFCAENNLGIAAVGWMELSASGNGEDRIDIGGRVHPDFRRRGLGSLLLEWAETRALQVFKSGVGLRLVIHNETLSADAHTIYQKFGFEPEFAEHMLVRALQGVLPVPSFPNGVHTQTWEAKTAGEFFQAYQASFRDRPGFPNPTVEDWVSDYVSEVGFRQDLSWVVIASDQPVAFITCSEFGGLGWVSQVGVAPEFRGQGIAFGLISTALQKFKSLGFIEAGLHVNVNNADAAMVFHQLGFRRRLTRARYVKVI
jgi:mycothiol synthase